MFLSFHRLWLKLWTSHKCGTISATRGKRQGQFGCWSLTAHWQLATGNLQLRHLPLPPTTSLANDAGIHENTLTSGIYMTRCTAS